MRVFAWAMCATAAAAGQLPTQGVSFVPPVMLDARMPHVSASLNMSNPQCCTYSAHMQEVLTLSELPLKRLLRVRLAMHPVERLGEPAEDNTEKQEAMPRAEALRSRERPRRPPVAPRGDIIDAGHDAPKQSKLATGFQLAITVLSFLAFGAYLISLVVSIVRNNSTTTTATTQQPFVLVPSQAGKRRKRRSDLPEWIPPSLPEPDHVFDAIMSAAQAYARFEGHEIDL